MSFWRLVDKFKVKIKLMLNPFTRRTSHANLALLKERPFLLIGSLFILILILSLVIELRTFCFELILELQSLQSWLQNLSVRLYWSNFEYFNVEIICQSIHYAYAVMNVHKSTDTGNNFPIDWCQIWTLHYPIERQPGQDRND